MGRRPIDGGDDRERGGVDLPEVATHLVGHIGLATVVGEGHEERSGAHGDRRHQGARGRIEDRDGIGCGGRSAQVVRSSTWLTHTSSPSGVTATLVGFDPAEPTDELAVGVSVPTTFRVAVSITLTEPE